MKETAKGNEIKGWIYSVMELLDFKLEVVENNRGINMSYNFIYHRLGIDFERVQLAKEELDLPVSLKTYIEVMTLHELGHAADREALLESLSWTIEVYNMKKAAPHDKHRTDPDLLNIIMDEQLMNLEFEKTAWNHAEAFNDQYQITDKKTFQSIRQHSLASYEKPYFQNLRLYEELLAGTTGLTA